MAQAERTFLQASNTAGFLGSKHGPSQALVKHLLHSGIFPCDELNRRFLVEHLLRKELYDAFVPILWEI